MNSTVLMNKTNSIVDSISFHTYKGILEEVLRYKDQCYMNEVSFFVS